MRSWIINTRLSQRLCVVGTTESGCLLFREHVIRQVILQDTLSFSQRAKVQEYKFSPPKSEKGLPGQGSPLSHVAFLYLYKRAKPFVFLFRLSWWLCQSSWLSASSVSPLCRVALSLGMSRMTSDFKLRSPFTQLGLHICLLFILAFG